MVVRHNLGRQEGCTFDDMKRGVFPRIKCLSNSGGVDFIFEISEEKKGSEYMTGFSFMFLRL